MAVANAGEAVAANRSAATRWRLVGPVFLLLMAELVFWLIAANDSSVIPGSWSAFTPDLELYLIINSISIGVFAQGSSVPLILEGNTGRFLKVFVAWAVVAWVATLLFLAYSVSGIPTPVNGTIAFQYLIYVGLFVGPSEELLFRVVVPPLVGRTYATQLVLSSAVFAAFHIGSYTASGVAWTPTALLFQLLQVGILGALFFLIAWKKTDPKTGRLTPRFGYAGCTGAHVAYDLTVLGVISGLGAAAAAAGLVAL